MSVKSFFVVDGCKDIAPFSESWDLKGRLLRYGRLKRTFLILAFFALSLNLRAPITSLPPVIGELHDALNISAGVGGCSPVSLFFALDFFV